MFSLKWFNILLNGETEKSPRKPEGPIMNMPDLVMRKIMENVDFITMLKLRKVCHAFRIFIDDTKLDNDLARVNITVSPSEIYSAIDFTSASRKPVNLHYIRYGKICLFKIEEGIMEKTKLVKNQDFVDAFFNDFVVILRNQSRPLKNMNIKEWLYDSYLLVYNDLVIINSHRASSSIYGWCSTSRPFEYSFEVYEHLREINDKCTLQSTADKFHDRFDCILKSRESLIPIQNLEMRVLRPSYFLNMIHLIDMNQLRGIVISEAYAENDEDDGKQLVLNEIVELDVFNCIQELCIMDFKVTLPLETFFHIPYLTVSVPTITIEDVLLIKKNMLTSPTAKSRKVYYDSIKDADMLHNTLGHAHRGYNQVSWYFKLPESDQTLEICGGNDGDCFSFKWINASRISTDAVVY